MEELHRLKDLLWQWFLEASEQPGFGAGMCIGMLGVAVLGYSFFMIRVWWGNVTAPYRPQTITQTFTTRNTPAQVMSRSLVAIVVGFVAMLCITCVVAEMLFPGLIEAALQNLGH